MKRDINVIEISESELLKLAQKKMYYGIIITIIIKSQNKEQKKIFVKIVI